MGDQIASKRMREIAKERVRKNWPLLVYQVFNTLYDRGFYPFAMSRLGWGLGGGALIAAAGSFIQCSIMFWAYDKMKWDWLSAQELRDLEKKPDLAWYEKALVWFGEEKKTLGGKIASYLVFIAASTQIDPLITAIHFKKRHFEGLRSGDWGILFTALAAANLWSIFETGLLVLAITYLWDQRHGILEFMLSLALM